MTNVETNIQTSRLLLRQWRDDDITPFVSMNKDPRVMEYFPALSSAQKTRSSVAKVRETIEKNGWGFWAAERQDSGEFIGFIGINPLQKGYPFAPCVCLLYTSPSPRD